MAGFYPDVPGPQIMYDRDESVGFTLSAGHTVTQLTAPQMTAINSDGEDAVGYDGGGSYSYMGIIFPVLHDLVGAFWSSPAHNMGVFGGGFETSPDTTNGLDGTWTSRDVFDGGYRTVRPYFRSLIRPMVVAGVKAIRITGQTGQQTEASAIHLYGKPSAGENPDRLRIWHPTVDAELGGAGLDFGDMPRLSVPTKRFRVKNNSAAMTANGVVVSVETLNDATPNVLAVARLDNAGSGYATTQTIGTLAPGALSGIITLRLSPPVDAALSLWRQRVKAAAASWA